MIFQVQLNKENNNSSRWPVKAVARTHTRGNAGQDENLSSDK